MYYVDPEFNRDRIKILKDENKFIKSAGNYQAVVSLIDLSKFMLE